MKRPAPVDAGAASERSLRWISSGVLLSLVAASFWSLDLRSSELLSLDSARRLADFAAELLHPDLQAAFLGKVADATLETLAMSTLGTLLAALLGLLVAFQRRLMHPPMAVLRAIPELVWASLLLVALGLGPFAGTLALALHTTGVLGRLYLEAFENLPDGPAFALTASGASPAQVFLYARLPQALPQLASYTLYRWENNIRAAAVLGVVGAGGLGQMLSFHLGLFQLGKASTVILVTLILVAVVDAASGVLRRRLG